MITKIVAKLKTGSITSVVPFGFPLPTPPYVVVSIKNDVAGRGTAFHIFTHMVPTALVQLNNYVRGELSTLLSDFKATSSNGNLNQLWQDYNQLPELVISNDDGTISMERVFWMPDKLN